MKPRVESAGVSGLTLYHKKPATSRLGAIGIVIRFEQEKKKERKGKKKGQSLK